MSYADLNTTGTVFAIMILPMKSKVSELHDFSTVESHVCSELAHEAVHRDVMFSMYQSVTSISLDKQHSRME